MVYERNQRVKSLLLREIVNFIKMEVNDPFLDSSFVNVVDLTLSKDLSYCRIFISTLVQGREDRVVQLLQEYSFLIRKTMGKKLHLKKIPQIFFVKDESLLYTAKIHSILSNTDVPDDKQGSL